MAVAVPALLIPVDAGAIVGGREDGGGHPNEGFVAALSAQGAVIDGCTGTLVAPAQVLTTAHCVGGKKLGLVDRYEVTFKPHAVLRGALDSAIAGRPVPNPRFDLRFQDTGDAAAFYRNTQYDVGVLVLDRRADEVYPGIEPAPLPAPQTVLPESRKRTPKFALVGYGVPRSGTFDGIRRVITAPLVKRADTLLFTRGGICLGDSGAPAFDAQGVVVSIASFIEGDCGGIAGGPRLDTGPTRSFLRTFGVG
jgi:hypothetical protein